MAINQEVTLGSILRREQRREYCGSIYWTRDYGRHGWVVTADGVVLCGPTTYEAATKALEEVAPKGE